MRLFFYPYNKIYSPLINSKNRKVYKVIWLYSISKMSKIITRLTGKYIPLPSSTYLFAQFKKGNFILTEDKFLFISEWSDEFRTEIIASKNINYGWLKSGYKCYEEVGQLLLNILPTFYRGTIKPEKIDNNPNIQNKKFNRHLCETPTINTLEECVISTANEIISQLPQNHKKNPYAITEGIIHWLKENIQHSMIRKKVIEQTVEIFQTLPQEKRNSSRDVLKHILKNKDVTQEEQIVLDKALQKFGNLIFLPENLNINNDFEFAECFLEKLDLSWEYISSLDDEKSQIKAGLKNVPKEEIKRGIKEMNQLYYTVFLKGNEEIVNPSAKITLEDRRGVCSGISRTFVALSRNLKIPSKLVVGCGMGESHEWAVSYISPLGWVEIDPTWGQFESFDYNTHAYKLSCGTNNLPELTIINSKKDFPQSKREGVPELVKHQEKKLFTNLRKENKQKILKFKKLLKEQGAT